MQRALAGKNYTHAKAGCVFAAALKVLPMFLIIFPGMISRVLFSGRILKGRNALNRRRENRLLYARRVRELMWTEDRLLQCRLSCFGT